jgi:hypothetical protein
VEASYGRQCLDCLADRYHRGSHRRTGLARHLFSWSSFGFPVTSTVYEVADHARVLWGGTAGGITGIHEWIFEETADGVPIPKHHRLKWP